VQLQTEIERKLGSRMSLASRAFLWLAALGIVGSLAAFAYVQRWFTPTIDLYFYAPTATGLNRGMAVKLVGFKVGTLEELYLVGELRVKGKIVIDRRQRDSIGKDSLVRLAKESLLGTYALELVPGSGDRGPVDNGNTLAYERELDYNALAAGLVERLGPVLDEIRNVAAQLGDKDGNLQRAIRRIDEAAAELTGMGRDVRRLAADGSTLVRGIPGRIDPVLDDARRRLQRTDAVLADVQRSLVHVDGILLRMDEALPGLLEDGRRTLQNTRAATENLNRALADDVPRLMKRGDALMDDADEVVGGVRRSWPVSSMLPQPAQKVIELDSADGAAHVPAHGAAPR